MLGGAPIGLNDEAERPIEGVLRTLVTSTLGANDFVGRLRATDYEALRQADGQHRLTMRQATPVVVAPSVPGWPGMYRFLTV